MTDSIYSLTIKIEESIKTCLSRFLRGHIALSEENINLLIAPWSHYFTHSALDRWVRNVSKKPSENLNIENVPGDTLSFMEHSRTNNYPDYLDASLEKRNIKRSLREESELLFIKPEKFSSTLVYQGGFNKIFLLNLSLCSALKIRRVRDVRQPRFFNINKEIREKLLEELISCLKENEAGTWLAYRATEYFPKSLLEGLPEILRFYEDHPIKRNLFSCNAWSIMDGWRIYCALQREKGAKLIGSPHSINYGTSKYFWLREFDLNNLDEYFTWGWQYPASRPIRFFSPPKFSGLKRPVKPSKISANDSILITSAARPRHLLEQPYSPERFEQYLSEQLRLANACQVLTEKKVCIRTRPKEMGWNLGDMIRKIDNPNIKLEFQSGKFLARLKKSSIHICDNTSTTILESLWINHPTLIYISDAYFEISEDAKPAYQLLQQTGIFHTSIESLANHLKSVNADINAWWNKKDVQDSIVKFLKIQGNPEGGIKAWKKALLN
mgnify:CR=1 FL=1